MPLGRRGCQRLIPTHDKNRVVGALALKVMQCHVLSEIEGLLFHFDGDEVYIHALESELSSYEVFDEWMLEDDFLKLLPMGKLQSLNESDFGAITFPQDWYNHMALEMFKAAVNMVNRYGEEDTIAMYRNRIFYRVFRNQVAWTQGSRINGVA